MSRYKKFSILILVLLAVVIAGGLALWLHHKPKSESPVKKSVTISHYAYKINIDSLNIRFGEVKNNQNLSTLLSKFVSGQIIDKIAKESGNVFDVRKIRSGQRFALLSKKDAPDQLLYFVYEINPIDYVVYDLRDSLMVYGGKKEVKINLKTASGTISSSLWNTFDSQNLDVNLALKLAEVYAWTVDFYGLQKGDRFRMIYEEIVVDSMVTGTGRIMAAVFTSGGKDFYGFYYEQNGNKAYFDDKGQSLERSFLKAPLRFTRISSRFSNSRMHPILRIARPHFGVDYAAPTGTPVVSLGNGRIYELGWKGGYGRFIGIRHNSIYSTTYAHLSGYAKRVHSGSTVKQGDLIGYVGSSGLATGPHLDFRVYKNGTPIDPLKLESPPAEPVSPSLVVRYNQMVKKMSAKLDSIK